MFYNYGEFMDLHIHTIFSDGKLNVEQILKLATETGLSTISITDHNTIDAYDYLKNIDISKYYTGRIINGAEINVVVCGNLLECLIYDFDLEKLKKYNFVQENWRNEQSKKIAFELGEKAKKLGLKIKDSFFNLPVYKTGFGEFYYELNSHSSNHQFLVKHNILSMREFFRYGFSVKKGIFNVDLTKYFMTIEDLREIIHDCGGVMVLAHPFGVYGVKNMKPIIKHLAKTRTVDGFECIHYQVSLKQTKYLLKLCSKYKLVKTAGSDFHKENHVLGYSYKSNLKTIIDEKLYFENKSAL